MRIVLSGGGTGGHVVPNLAVIEELRSITKTPGLPRLRRVTPGVGFGIETLYIGEKNGVEEKMMAKAGVSFEGIVCGKLRRYFSFQNFIDFFKVPVGIFQAKKILKKFKPDVVFSKGGYVGFPVAVAAKWLKIPVILHESDAVIGMANKMSMKYADKIFLSFEETKNNLPEQYRKKAVVTGNPVRKSIFEGDAEKGRELTGFDKHSPVLLIIGGSQGAQQINDLLRASMDELLKKFQIVHVRGRGNLDISLHKKGYVQYEYLDEDLKDIFAMTEMVITRGGANSLFEIALLKKKTLIIPLGLSGSRGEQIANAQIFCKELGWAMLCGEIGRDQFLEAVMMAFKNEINESEKFANGVDKIVDLILSRF